MILCEISRGSSQDTNIFLGSATRATAVAVWSTGPPIYYAINIEGCRQIRELAAKRNVSTTSHWAKSGRLLRKLSIHALLMLLWTIWSASPLPTTLNRLTCDLCFETVVTMLWLSMALRIATDPGVWCIIFNQRCWQSWLVSSNREIAFILHWIKFRELHLSCIGSSSESCIYPALDQVQRDLGQFHQTVRVLLSRNGSSSERGPTSLEFQESLKEVSDGVARTC